MNAADRNSRLYLAAHDLWRRQETVKNGAGLRTGMQDPHPTPGELNLSSIL